MEHLMSLMEKNEAAGREAQRAEGERSEAAGGSAAPEAVPDPELTERPKRRHFSAEFKLAVLKLIYPRKNGVGILESGGLLGCV